MAADKAVSKPAKLDFLKSLPFYRSGQSPVYDVSLADKPLAKVFQNVIVSTNEEVVQMIVEKCLDEGRTIQEMACSLSNRIVGCGSTSGSSFTSEYGAAPLTEDDEQRAGTIKPTVNNPERQRLQKVWTAWRANIVVECITIVKDYLTKTYGQVVKNDKTGESIGFEKGLSFVNKGAGNLPNIIRIAPGAVF